MGKSRIFTAAAVVGLLAAPTALAAGSNKVHQAGDVQGDSQAGVQLVVIERGGAPKSVKNVKVTDLLTDCKSGSERITLRLYDGAAKVGANNRFDMAYVDGRSKVRLRGKVRSDGSRVHASITGTTVKVAGVGRCEVPSIEFTTKR